MKKPALAFLTLVVALAVAISAQAQTPPPPTTPTNPTAYNAFNLVLAQPTSGPIMQTPVGATQCAIVLNAPSTNTSITPQGSDDFYTWHALPTVGGGSIRFPGLYVGTNPYKYFRPYFTNYASPGITGYEACGDNATSLIAPMLNGENGVLNAYQQLTAIGHAGCATFDAGGNLLAQGGGLPCGGGGGSFVCDAPHSCVTFQTLPSPSPEATAAGGNSAAVAGILQGGSLWTVGGFLNSQNGVLSFCADEPNGFCDAEGFAGFRLFDSSEGMTLEQTGNFASFSEFGTSPEFDVSAGGNGFASSSSGKVRLKALDPSGVTMAQLFLDAPGSPPEGQLFATEIDLDTTLSSAPEATPDPASLIRVGEHANIVDVLCCGGVPGATVNIGDNSGFAGTSGPWDSIMLSGRLVGGSSPTHVGTSPWGTCVMSSATTCAIIYNLYGYTDGMCLATVQGSTPIAAACSLSGNTVTITAATSNSDTWGFIVLGVPN